MARFVCHPRQFLANDVVSCCGNNNPSLEPTTKMMCANMGTALFWCNDVKHSSGRVYAYVWYEFSAGLDFFVPSVFWREFHFQRNLAGETSLLTIVNYS